MLSILGGVVLLGETLTPLVALGGVTVIAGVALIMVRRGTMAAPEAGARRFDVER